MDCCGEMYSTENSFCSICRSELKKNSAIEIKQTLDSFVGSESGYFHVKLGDEFMSSNYGSDLFRKWLLNYCCGLVLRKSEANFDLNVAVYDVGHDGRSRKVNSNKTNEFNKKLLSLGEIVLYKCRCEDDTADKIYTYDELRILMKLELSVFDFDSIFAKQIVYKNVTIKYMDDRVNKFLADLKNNFRNPRLAIKLKNDIHPLKAMMMLLGFIE